MGLHHFPAPPTLLSRFPGPFPTHPRPHPPPPMGLHMVSTAAEWQALSSSAFRSGPGWHGHLHVKAESLPTSLGNDTLVPREEAPVS